MATRTQFPTGPHRDGKQPHDKKGRGSSMSEQSFKSSLLMVAAAPHEAQMQIRHATYTSLRRLGVRRDLGLKVKVPRLQDKSVDARSIIDWAERVQPGHRNAIWQLRTIDATVVALTS